jgi:hypothetical protein
MRQPLPTDAASLFCLANIAIFMQYLCETVFLSLSCVKTISLLQEMFPCSLRLFFLHSVSPCYFGGESTLT